jgi:peptide/nickel transport system permease protein
MGLYLIRRLCSMVFILLCVSIITFSLMYIVPGDPAQIIAEKRYGEEITEQIVERVRVETGLNQPLMLRYLCWLAGILQGDFGYSSNSGRPVLQEIIGKLPATVELALMAMLVSLLIAIPIGIVSAVKQYSFLDNIGMVGAMLGVSMPNFWLGPLLILIFAVHLGWFPVFGSGGLNNLILPSITLGTGLAAITVRLTRSSLLEVLKQDYIRTARSKGLSERVVVNKHALKNALIPIVTVVGLQFGSLLEGTVVVEVVFAWPGLGSLLVDSIFARDFPMIQGCVFFIAIMYVIVNLLVDLSYAWLDPRIRYEAK